MHRAVRFLPLRTRYRCLPRRGLRGIEPRSPMTWRRANLTKKSPDRESRGSVFCQTDPARRLPFVPASSGPSASYRFMARCRQQSGTALTFQSQRNSARPVRKSVATCSQKMSLDPEYARSRLRTKSQESARAAMRTRAASHPMLDSAWRIHRREFRSTGYHPP